MADARRLKAIASYDAQADGELTINKGDVIFVPPNQPDGRMIKGVSGGKVGLFPREIVQDTTIEHTDGSATPVKAIHDYTAANDEEVSFPLGAKLFVVTRLNNDWWKGVYNGAAGKIPASHVAAWTEERVANSMSEAEAESRRADILGALDSKIGRVVPGMSIKKKKNAGGMTRSGRAMSRKNSVPDFDEVGDIEVPDWDWGKTPKNRAERELTGQKEGTFLVRASESESGSFSISVVSSGEVRHIRILQLPGGFGISKAEKPTATIPELIKLKQGQTMTSRAKGSSAAMKESRLLVRPWPRKMWKDCPMALAYNAHPKMPKAPPSQKSADPFAADPFATPAVPTTAPTFVMNPIEEKIYNGLWKRAPGSDTGSSAAGACAPFLASSGLDKKVLAHIWNFSDILEPKGQLSQQEFFVALKLIALKQSGSNFAIKYINNPAKVPQLKGHTELVQAENKPPPPMPTSGNLGNWVVPKADFSTYKGFFDGVDADKDGYVIGAEVMGIFTASKLDKAILGEIWNLVDIKRNGMLNVEQFALAMYFIAQKVKNVDVPTKLSPEMVPPSLREKEEEPAVVVDPFANPTPALVPEQVAVDPFAAQPAPVAGATVDPFAAPPAADPAGATSPSGFLSNEEAQIYKGLWTKATGGTATFLGPGEAVAFMQASGLDNAVLAQIWEAADVEAPKGQLVETEFFVALKCIALKQAGIDAIPENISMSSSLPVIGSFTEEIKASLAPAPEPTPAANLSLSLDDNESKAYSKFWEYAVPNGAEFIGPGEAVGFFQSSGLENEVLGAIWEVADASEPRGQLNKTEFNVALKLIAVKQSGADAVMANIGQNTPLPQLTGHTDSVIAELNPDKTIELAGKLWGMAAANVDADGCLDGGTLRPLLMTSKLDPAVLGEIWAKADADSVGKLNASQFESLLRFISQAQNGESLDSATFTPSMPPPVLEGL